MWNLGTLAGALAGQVIGDTDAFGLDAAFPAALLALVLPALRGTPRTRNAALLGAAVALATTPFLPAGRAGAAGAGRAGRPDPGARTEPRRHGMTITAILVLAVGTYAFRVAGPLLRARWPGQGRRGRPAAAARPS